MTVRINLDLPSVERLIGGDTEAEVTLRNGIVQTFTRKYLKDIVKQENFRRLVEEVRTAIINEFRAEIPLKKKEIGSSWARKYQWWIDSDTTFGKELSSAIREQARQAAMDLISKNLDPLWDEIREECYKRIEDHKKRLTNHISNEVNKRITRQFNTMVEAAILQRIRDVSMEVAPT